MPTARNQVSPLALVAHFRRLAAAVQDLGRAPLLIRKFFLKYQDRILFGSDGNPARGVEEFWIPHFRFLETYDEHFDHPAQLRSPWGRRCTH